MTESLLAGLALGLVLAAQVGPVTLLIARSILRGGRGLAVGFAMAGAVALVDLGYATVGLAGAGRLLDEGWLGPMLGLVSAAILMVIGARTAWAGLTARSGLEDPDDIVLPRYAFATAVAATASNPLTIVLWTVSFPAAAPAAARSSGGAALALAGVALATLAWYCGFACVVALLRARLGERVRRAVDIGSGCGLMVFGGLTAYRSAHEA